MPFPYPLSHHTTPVEYPAPGHPEPRDVPLPRLVEAVTGRSGQKGMQIVEWICETQLNITYGTAIVESNKYAMYMVGNIFPLIAVVYLVCSSWG